MGHESKQGLFLHGLEGKGVSFYSILAEKKIHGSLAAVAWFDRLLATLSSSSDDPLVIGTG
jgi:hypothetical protein